MEFFFLESLNLGGQKLEMIQDFPLLSTLTFLPLVGALLLLLFKGEREKEIKATGTFFSILTFFASLLLLPNFQSEQAYFQFVENQEWIELFNVRYTMGIDGISLLLVLLTTFLTPIVMLSSLSSVKKRVKEYFIALLILETAMLGAFCALDLFLFYVFFEIMLIPMYLLIGIWGGANRIYAAVKFFIYTLVGSLLMFLAILYCYVVSKGYTGTGEGTFLISQLSAEGSLGLTQILPQAWHLEALRGAGTLCFLAFMLSFAIKTPLFPFHTWLPDAHTEAPTGGSVILAGVMLKLGTYGMLRFCIAFFPSQALDWSPFIVALAVIGIVYGALMALAQEDLKKLVAYSSVSHLGFVVLGLFAFTEQAAQGALLQMINHGLSTGLLFLLVGCIYERRHTRFIEEFGGLGHVMPKFSIFFMIATLASIGLPGLNGFVGEFLILLGSFGALEGGEVSGGLGWNWMRTATLIAGSGIILGAVYMLWAYQRVVFGKLVHPENKKLKDLSKREVGYLVPLVFFCFLIGLQPRLFIEPMEKPIKTLLAPAQAARAAEIARDKQVSQPFEEEQNKEE